MVWVRVVPCVRQAKRRGAAVAEAALAGAAALAVWQLLARPIPQLRWPEPAMDAGLIESC